MENENVINSQTVDLCSDRRWRFDGRRIDHDSSGTPGPADDDERERAERACESRLPRWGH